MKRHIEISGPNGIRVVQSDEKGNLRYSLADGETGKIIESNGTMRAHTVEVSAGDISPAIGDQMQKTARTISIDDKLNKLAAMLFIPAADAARIVGNALGISCAACQVRFQIWKKAQEIGWKQVIWLTWKSIRAQANHDEAQLEEMAKELES